VQCTVVLWCVATFLGMAFERGACSCHCSSHWLVVRVQDRCLSSQAGVHSCVLFSDWSGHPGGQCTSTRQFMHPLLFASTVAGILQCKQLMLFLPVVQQAKEGIITVS
jgi:hypothetical protein